MLRIDGHLDLAYNAVELHRDVTLPVAEIRAREASPPAHGEGTATVSLPALRDADIRIVFGTLFTYAEGGSTSLHPGYRTPEEAFQRADAQVAYYHQLHDRREATILFEQADLNRVLDEQAPAPGLCLLMEGADPLRTVHDLEYFYERGVRIIGLAWKATRCAGGVGMPGPLTAYGREVLQEMQRLNMALDASHLDEEAFWQAVRVFPGRIVASHANCRAIVPGSRQLSDDMIRAIADRDGVVGLVCYNRFILPGWSSAQGKAAVSLRDLLPHAAHLATLVGPRHIALGSDLDGGIGREDIPAELETITDLPRFAELLAQAGYGHSDIEGIMGENWLRVLRGVLY